MADEVADEGAQGGRNGHRPVLRRRTLLVNKLAFAHMLPHGGQVTFRAIRGPEAIREAAAGRRLEAFVVFDAGVAHAIGAQPEQEWGQWFAGAVQDMCGQHVHPWNPKTDDAPMLDKDEIYYVEMDLVASPIAVPGQPQFRIVGHWFAVTAAPTVPDARGVVQQASS